MIQVKNLSHSYSKDENFAVKNISFEISKGEIFGFLGPSGAGKSTTQGVLTGLLPLQSGNVEVVNTNMARPSRDLYNHIGVSFEQSNVYNKLTALENLTFYAKLFDVPTQVPMDLLKLVGLDHVAHKKAGTFSKGMKHRLTFVRSMLNNPRLWFLDEPTTGLDPAIANEIKTIIKQKNDSGTTIFLTTHNMHVAETLCHRVAFIIDGEIKLIDSPNALKLKFGEKFVNITHHDAKGKQVEKLSLVDAEDQKRMAHIIQNGNIETMHTTEATLEEIFIKVTGRGLE